MNAHRQPDHFACTPDDLTETGADYLGLLVVLVDVAGWRVYGRRRESENVFVLTACGDGIEVSENGPTDQAAALALFKHLYSDEPDAIAMAASFWPPPRPVTRIGLAA